MIVIKVGSETIKSLLKGLQKRNNFTHIVDSAEVKRKQGEKTFISKVINEDNCRH